MVQQQVAQEVIAQEVELSASTVQEQENAADGALDADREGYGGGYHGSKKKKKPKKKLKEPDGSVSKKTHHLSFNVTV